jgi:hypothetical protein
VLCLLIAIVATSAPGWWYGAFVVFPTLSAGAAASYAFPPPPQEVLDSATWRGLGRRASRADDQDRPS